MTYKNIGNIDFEPELTNEEVEDLHAFFSGGAEHNEEDDVFSLAHRINDIVNTFLENDEQTTVRRRRRK